MKGYARVFTVTAAALLLAAATMATAQSVVALSMSPQTLIGGNLSTGAVRLNVAAPSGGAVVALSSSDTTAATVPSTVTVAAGATVAHFPIATLGVSATHTLTITGTLNGSAGAGMQVWRAYISSVALVATAVVAGNSATGTVYLNGYSPPGGLDCALSTSNTCAQVPTDVVVPYGVRFATFTVTTTPVPTSKSLTVYASALGSIRGVGLKVIANGITSVTLNPAIIDGNLTSVGTVNLAAPAPSGGLPVALSSTNAWATVPAGITVAGGASSGTFTVNTTSPYTNKAGTIYASANGATHGTGVEVLIPRVIGVIKPPFVPGGSSGLQVGVQIPAKPYSTFILNTTCDTPLFKYTFQGPVENWTEDPTYGWFAVKPYDNVPDPPVDTTVTVYLTDPISGAVYSFQILVTHT